jgi:L-ribulose-5-phosphate 3-epimerase
MSHLKLGVSLNSLGVPFRRALMEAQKLNVAGAELDAAGDFGPRSLSQTGRRQLRHLFRSHNLELAALACPLRHGLDIRENQQQRLDHVRDVMSLSFDLGPRLVVLQAGGLPEKEDDPRIAPMKEALEALAQHADRVGVRLALVTGLEAGAVIKKYLDLMDTGALGACFDPGSLLANGYSPQDSARALATSLIYAHATDARHAGAGKTGREVPLGHGDIDWLGMLATLAEIDYHGWLTIVGQGIAEVGAGVAFLRRLTGA